MSRCFILNFLFFSRIRTNSRHADKGVNGGLVYDDIPIAASLRSPRGRDSDRATYKTAPISDPIIGGSTHVYVPEPRSAPPSEHFYQTISSGELLSDISYVG